MIVYLAMIKELFSQVFSHYSSDETLWHSTWHQIDRHYKRKARHYHTLTHLENLAQELLTVKELFKNWHTAVFAIVYHDIIYNPLRKNNEERSAAYAERKLRLISFPPADVQQCKAIILATKLHTLDEDHEINLFTDADLSILGADPDAYMLYCNQIRKEYSVYPDFMYKPGRRKVLEHFLKMDRIFKTEPFRKKYETSARNNLSYELEVLTRDHR
jgi:predicted metal-dependent HD superfamily phosphohydrolase